MSTFREPRECKHWKVPKNIIKFDDATRREFRRILNGYKTRIYGSTTNGYCKVITNYASVVSDKNTVTDVPPNITPHQMRFAEYYGYLPNNLITTKKKRGRKRKGIHNNTNNKKPKYTISHQCGKHECISRQHLLLELQGKNNKRQKCHRLIRKLKYKLISTGQYFQYFLKCDECKCEPKCFMSCIERY